MTHHKIHTVNMSSTELPGITSSNLELNSNMVAELTAGNRSPQHVAMVSQKIAHTMSTMSLTAALDIVGSQGYTTDGSPAMVVNLQNMDVYGQGAVGSVHRSLTFNRARTVPTSITVNNQGDATLEMRTAIIYNGTNDAVVISDLETLPAVTNTETRHTLGPISVGGVTLSQYTSVTVTFGNSLSSEAVASDVYDTLITEATHTPTITITGIDAEWFKASGAIPIGGLAATHANSSVTFRKRDQTGSHFVAGATTEHVKVTIAGLAAVTSAVSGGAVVRPTETSLVIQGAIDSSGNAPVILTTNAIHA